MSLWKHLFDSDLRQREDIDFLQANASVNRATNDRLTADSRELEQIVERQALLLETLYRVVVDGGLITKEGFKELVTQVDLEDGIEDGTDQLREAREPQAGLLCVLPRGGARRAEEEAKATRVRLSPLTRASPL